MIKEKKAGVELGLGPASKELEMFLGEEIDRIKKSVLSLPEHGRDMGELNEYFRKKLIGQIKG